MVYVNKVVKYTKPRIVIETPKAVEENPVTVAENATVEEQEKTESRRGRKPKNEQ